MARSMGHRTILSVPLLREGESIGAIVLRRTEVHPFSDKQIALLQTFADQAVIAIGNVRLFDEVQATTRDLTESLEQQTATSEVLEVISASTGELEPVFQKMLENATRVCGANFGTMSLYEGGQLPERRALQCAPTHSPNSCGTPFRPHPKSGLGHGDARPCRWSRSKIFGHSRPISKATRPSSHCPISRAPGRSSSSRCSGKMN